MGAMVGFIVVQAVGSPFERGRAIGKGLGEAIEHSLGFVRRFLDGHGIGSRRSITCLGRTLPLPRRPCRI